MIAYVIFDNDSPQYVVAPESDDPRVMEIAKIRAERQLAKLRQEYYDQYYSGSNLKEYLSVHYWHIHEVKSEVIQ